MQVMTISGAGSLKPSAVTLQPMVTVLQNWFGTGRTSTVTGPGRGVYIYKLRVISPDKKTKEVLGKLVIL